MTKTCDNHNMDDVIQVLLVTKTCDNNMPLLNMPLLYPRSVALAARLQGVCTENNEWDEVCVFVCVPRLSLCLCVYLL